MNRIVKCDLSWDNLQDSKGSEVILNSNGDNRTLAFKKLSQNWSDLEPVLENMLKEIKQ